MDFRILYNMVYDMRTQAHEAYADGNAAAVVSPGRPLWLCLGDNLGENDIRLFFYACRQRFTLPLCGLVAPKNAALICAEMVGEPYTTREIAAYYLQNELPPAKGFTGGFLREAGSGDAVTLEKWLAEFYSEALETDFPKSGGDMKRKTTNKLYIWQDKGPSAMGMLCGGDDITMRLNLIYTPRDLRRRGYGAAVVRSLAEMAVKAGKIPALYTAVENGAANRLYRSLGFQEAGRLTEVTFRG